MFEWTDPDTNTVYEINYVVTQGPDEGPEYFEYRVKQKFAPWIRLPPFALDPEVAKAASDHFFGPLISMPDASKADLKCDVLLNPLFPGTPVAIQLDGGRAYEPVIGFVADLGKIGDDAVWVTFPTDYEQEMGAFSTNIIADDLIAVNAIR